MATIKELREQAAKTLTEARSMLDGINDKSTKEQRAEAEIAVDKALAETAEIEARAERMGKLEAAEKRAEEAKAHETSLEEIKRQLENAEIHLKTQEELIASLQNDLRDSVKKTRELRSELTDRATENLRSEVKLREVETELSVAQASTDMIATGVLDYSIGEVGDDDDDGAPEIQQSMS